MKNRLFLSVILTLVLTTLLTSTRASAPCIIYESSPYGFGSNILGLLLTLATQNKSTQTYFDESSWQYKCYGTPGWSYFFSGPTPTVISENILPTGCTRVKYEGTELSGHDILKNEDPTKVFRMLRHSVQQVWRLSGHMKRKADAQAAFLKSLRKPLIGVVIRAGDKALEDQMWGNRPAKWYQEKEWVANLKILLQQNNWPLSGGTCILYGDDLVALHDATKTLKAEMKCMVIQIGGWEGGFHREKWMENAMSSQSVSDPYAVAEEYCSAAIDLIMQLEALCVADVFVGNYNSNLPRLVHLLRVHVFGKAIESAQDVLKNIGWHHDYRFESYKRG